MTVIKDFMLTNNMISGLAAFLKDLLQTLVKMKICDFSKMNYVHIYKQMDNEKLQLQEKRLYKN